MPYAVQRVLLGGTGTPEVMLAGSLCGFPASFNYILVSEWVCLGTGGARSVGLTFPGYSLAINVSQNRISIDIGYGHSIFSGIFNVALNNIFSHLLVSIDPTTQRIQVYLNDAAVVLTSGSWTGAGPFDFTFALRDWHLLAAGSFAPGSGVGDVWTSNMPSFVDLSIVANRRKFINADLTPVDLGNTGSAPFGAQPPVFLTVRPGDSNPNHFASNNGSGGAFTITGGALAFEPALGCIPAVAPPPVPVAPGVPLLAIDDVICTISPQNTENLISLRWSDDRGHVWGSPVTQDIGEAGEYRTSLQWQRLAYARDRVFEISWSVPMRTALQGCWVDVTPAQS